MAELIHKELSYIIQGCVYEIRNQYGAGQKEKVYQNLMLEKFEIKKIKAEKEKRINIYSQDTGKIVGIYQPDILVDDKIIIELKSTNFARIDDEKQLYNYLRNSKYELGYLVNFSTPQVFIKRIVYANLRKTFFSCKELVN